MSLTLVATAASASANSYCTLASANDYLQQNIHTYSTWAALATTDAEACLIFATSLLDKQMDWVGTKGSSSQALRWPRDDVSDADGYAVDSESIPKFLREATAEYARWLSVKDRTAEDPTRGFSRLEAGGLAAYIDKHDRVEVMPELVYSMIKEFGGKASSRTRVLERI